MVERDAGAPLRSSKRKRVQKMVYFVRSRFSN